MNDGQLLIHEYLSGAITAERFDQLCHWLLESPDNARLFAELSLVDQQLFDVYKHQALEQMGRRVVETDLAANEAFYEMIEEAVDKQRRMTSAVQVQPPVADITSDEEPEAIRRVIVIPRWLVWGGVAAAIALLVSVASLYLWPNSGPQNVTTIAEGTPPAEDPAVAPAVAALRPVATITDQLEARWRASAAITVGQRLMEGDTLTLTSGYAEITCDRGAVVTVEAPSQIRIVDDNTLMLTAGRLVARCPRSAWRFTVRTPRSQIVDFGTEFGVHVAEDGGTETLVYTGLVELSEATAEPAQPAQSVRLTAGWGSTVDASGQLAAAATRIEPSDELRFARSMRQAGDPEFQYQRQVLAAKPIGYWRFENLASSRQINAARPGVYDLAMIGDVRETSGVFGRSIALRSQPETASLLRSREPLAELAGLDSFSVELWCRPEAVHDGTLVDLFLETNEESGAPHALVAEMRMSDDPRYNPPTPPSQYVRVLHGDPPTSAPGAGINVYSRDKYEPGRWLYVVAVKQPDRLELYIDGELVNAIDDYAAISVAPYLMVGCSGNLWEMFETVAPNPPIVDELRQFRGVIDELAVYAQPLEAGQIKLRYLTGQSQLNP